MAFSQKKFESLSLSNKASRLSDLLRAYLESENSSKECLEEYYLYLSWVPFVQQPPKHFSHEDQYHYWQKLRGHSQGLLSLPHRQIELRKTSEFLKAQKGPSSLSWSVLLDNFRSGHNTGSVIRTADTMGFEKVHLGGQTPNQSSKSVQSAAMGAEAWVPQESHENTIAWLQKQTLPKVALELTQESLPLSEWAPPSSGILILGNEERGISKEIAELCDSFIYIPMQGRKYSMNVASAFAIAAYHIGEQLRK
jgi:tRNA G18 (ribose-2'-O)-methylase SpoU